MCRDLVNDQLRIGARDRSATTTGIYNDGPFALVETENGRRVSPDAADFPFLTFACEVGTRLGSTTGLRTQRSNVRRGRPLAASPRRGVFKGFPRTTAFCASIRCFARHPALRVGSGAASRESMPSGCSAPIRSHFCSSVSRSFDVDESC